ncbi:hypothetical protein SAE01_41350 [Segetibacter aerophilus]|uniref:F5/8 type C domain-containing protein n=2 Tax=Segetibacter aerophilus TaxID=670293 RepID=A0A512BI26_9BACT|nr:hypothetical protein SAE01_41350 [Segetibacter aerophilus]
MNGNITKTGIRKDLQWMHRAGIGGFQNFDAAFATPQIVEKRLVYMTPDWKEAFQLATKLADSLHLEMAIAGSPGWSESGGPWVQPESGMKKIVWSETRLKGGASNITVPAPPAVTGPFQSIPKQAGLSLTTEQKEPPAFYRDILVLAYKVPETDVPLTDLKPVVTSSGGSFSLGQLVDGDLSKTSLLPIDSIKGYAWIQFAFAQPQTIKAITMVGGGDKGPFGLNGELKDNRSLEVSDDGQNFTRVSYIPASNVLQQTISIPATTARYFRVTVKNPAAGGFGAAFGGARPKPPMGTEIAELVLHTCSRINMFEEKAAFAPATGLYTKATTGTTEHIETKDIVDVTSKLNADGTLNWTVPPGSWKVVRFGYSLTGITNHPASPEATGLEVDKLDPAAVKNYFENYLNQYKEATGGLMGNKGGLQFMVTDSWEAGAQNWTPNMLQEFQKRRGYSMVQWMPALTGQVVQSAEASERFLWDFRKTLSDLVAEYHYDQLTTLLQQYGMKRYSESHEDRRAIIADGMEVKRTATIPMSAMWTPGPGNRADQTRFVADIRESASVAHIYGQNLVAAESLTAIGVGGFAWSYSPENLKPTADLELASGVNRFVIHTSVHQPVDNKIPGLGLGPFGQWFNRHETWAEQAKAWTDYLSRSSYLLQQGRFVADALYYYGEDNNITSLYGNGLPNIPYGYNYDFVNADALVNLLSVKDGKIVTPSGMSYRVLMLDSNATKMSLPVLRKLRTLVKAGATVTGITPVGTPSLADDSKEFERIKDEIWNSGNNRVSSNKALSEVLKGLNITPDFAYSKRDESTKLLFVHRKLSDRDLYWVNNRNHRKEDVQATFRITGKVPEIWHPETGRTEPASYEIANGVTKVDMHLQPDDAVFVIFKMPATKTAVKVPAPSEKVLVAVDGEWDVSFQPNRGAPAKSVFNQLNSWTENTDPGIKYFSGTATYTKTINAPAAWFGNKKLETSIDLTDVKNIAEVMVNGKSAGIVWKQPYRVKITNALKVGANKLEIKVTNLWPNRLIGDQQPGVTNKITYTTMPFYQAGSPLLPSGLLGPVKIISVNKN